MYEQFFGLRERPFDLTPDPRFLVMTESHAEVLSTLQYAIASRKGVTVLIGEAGLGKTTVLRAAMEGQPERVRCIVIQNPVLSRSEFVELLARSFELSTEARRSKTALLFELEERLQQARRANETTVLVIDEAQSLPHELLEEVRLLANIDTKNDRLLSVILAGQPELAGRLNDPALRQFKQRVALRCQLRPLDRDEVAAYLSGRIFAAGGAGGQVLTREAVNEIFTRSGGVPRTVSVIADNALLGGFAAEIRPVTAAIVREACADLDLPEPSGRNGQEPGRHAHKKPAAADTPDRGRESVHKDGRPRSALAPASAEPAVQYRPMFEGFARKRRFFFFGS
jgi:general secretion pathway protein A